MKDREITRLMRDISPLYQLKADERARNAAAKPRRNPLPVLLTAGAAVCCLAGGIVLLPRLHARNTVPAEPTDPAAVTVTQPTEPAQEIAVLNAPIGDFSDDKAVLLSPAYAPYVLDLSPEQQRELSQTLLSEQWQRWEYLSYVEEPEGEAAILYVYNNGEPYRLAAYGNGCIMYEQVTGENMYQDSFWHAQTAADAIRKAANPDDPDALEGHLTHCAYDLTTPETPWRNIRMGGRACDMMTQEGIFYKIRNTVDYFDRASGTAVWCSNVEVAGQSCWQIQRSEFRTDLKLAKACETVQTYLQSNPEPIEPESEPFDTITEYMDPFSHYRMTLNSTPEILSLKTMFRYNSSPLENDKVHSSAGGVDGWHYRGKITNCLGGKQCLEPQEMAVGFLWDYSRWEITGTDVLNGRDVVHLCGKLTGAYSEKQNVVDFTFDVDIETGALLCYLGYDADGNLSDFMITEDIAFDENAERVTAADFLCYESICEDRIEKGYW